MLFLPAYQNKLSNHSRLLSDSPSGKPGETVEVLVDYGSSLNQADLLLFTATDPHGKELYTWSWPVVQPKENAGELLAQLNTGNAEITVKETETAVLASVSGLEIGFSKEDGTLVSVKNEKGSVSFTGGPVATGVSGTVTGTKWETLADGSFSFEITTDNYPRKMTWHLAKNGLLKLEATPLRERLNNIDFIGVSFNYPEAKCTGVKWMRRGPYRVWKNRMKGGKIGVWEKAYNNTVTGESFGNLEYPEFKGYHGNLFWATLQTSETPITIITGTPNLYLQLFKPEEPKHVAGGTHPPFPEGDISFLLEIPAIGTKFYQAADLGPGSQKGRYMERKGDQTPGIEIWFDFRDKYF